MNAGQHGSETGRGSTVISRGEDGQIEIEASGSNFPSALEAALRAILALSGETNDSHSATERSAPLRGEGIDYASLFAAMIDDLLAQLEIHGQAADITIDGVVRRDDGGYVGWGYVHGQLNGAPLERLPVLAAHPSVVENERGCLVLSACLAADRSPR